MQKEGYLNRVATARAEATKSLTPDKMRALGTALSALGDYSARIERNFTGAIAAFEEAISIFEEIDDSTNLAKAYFNLGVAYELGFQNYETAARYVRKALDLTEDPRLRAYYESELSCLATSRLKQGQT
jgi:tetratricopeptide (TPR) repeat protein